MTSTLLGEPSGGRNVSEVMLFTMTQAAARLVWERRGHKISLQEMSCIRKDGLKTIRAMIGREERDREKRN